MVHWIHPPSFLARNLYTKKQILNVIYLMFHYPAHAHHVLPTMLILVYDLHRDHSHHCC